jgi:hypothetical protein
MVYRVCSAWPLGDEIKEGEMDSICSLHARGVHRMYENLRKESTWET